MRRLLPVLLALVVAPPAAAQSPLNVYSTLPTHGPSVPQTRDIARGARLALERAGNQAGGRPIRYVPLSHSTRRAGGWTPEGVSENARRIAQDDAAIGVVGPFNSGAAAVAIPILNEANILLVSPSNTHTGLTRRAPGTDPGEPDKYYPVGTRTYGRLSPNDSVQARAGGAALRDAGVKRVLVVHDGDLYGRGVGLGVRSAARTRGVRVVGFRRLAQRGRNARDVARAVRRARADAVFYAGITDSGAVRLWRSLAGVRGVQLFGSDGIAESAFAERISVSAARRTRVLVGTLAPQEYPAAGQEVLTALGPDTDPYALYGYEAMAVILDAINRGGPEKEGVLEAFFATRDRDSVLGRYSIDENGDVSTTRYGRYRIERGQLVFDGVVDAAR